MLHTHTHRHTPPHHEDEHPAVEKLDCTDFAVMSRELDRAADLTTAAGLLWTGFRPPFNLRPARPLSMQGREALWP